MESEVVFRKRWHFSSRLSLEEICDRIRCETDLPAFTYGSHDDEWGISEREGVEVNITHILESHSRRLENLPRGCPDYNYLVIASISQKALDGASSHWFLDHPVAKLSQQLANAVGTDVGHVISDSLVDAKFIAFRPQRESRG